MGWEERSGHLYYYRKRRHGKRVVSEYVGRGDLAEAIAHLDELERAERASERDMVRAERKQDRLIAAEVDLVSDIVRAVTHAMLLTTGNHTHRGQWRRKRER